RSIAPRSIACDMSPRGAPLRISRCVGHGREEEGEDVRLLALNVSCVIAVGAASAGRSAERPVSIDVAARWASGFARSDSVDPIGCRVVSALGLRSAVCYAATAHANVSCVTRDPALVDAAAAARRGGYLRFAWDEAETCTAIDVSVNAPPA